MPPKIRIASHPVQGTSIRFHNGVREVSRQIDNRALPPSPPTRSTQQFCSIRRTFIGMLARDRKGNPWIRTKQG